MLKPKSQPVTETAPEEPTLESVSPEYAEMSRLHRHLIARESELLAKLPPLVKAINGSGLALFNEQNAFNRERAIADVDKPPRVIGPSKGAAALLGEFAPAPTPVPGPLAHEPAIMKAANEVSRDLREVQEALKHLGPK